MADFLGDLCDHGVHGVLIGDVADIAVSLDASFFISGEALIDQLLLDVVEDDGSAVCGHCLCDSHADAVRCAGDERDLAGQVKGFGSTLCHDKVLQSKFCFAGRCAAGLYQWPIPAVTGSGGGPSGHAPSCILE